MRRGGIRGFESRVGKSMLRHRLSLQKVFWRDKFYDKITHR